MSCQRHVTGLMARLRDGQMTTHFGPVWPKPNTDTGGELSSPIYNRRWCVADTVGLLAPVELRAHMPPASTLSLIRKMMYTEVVGKHAIARLRGKGRVNTWLRMPSDVYRCKPRHNFVYASGEFSRLTGVV